MLTIANALCFLPESKTAPNLDGDNHLSLKEIYLRNAWVSLWTARHFHPESRRLLITNLEDNGLSEFYSDVDAEVVHVPWDAYVLPEQYRWRLAYYKLRALEFLAEIEGSSLLLDADAFFVSKIDDLLAESEEGLFLYDTLHRHGHPFRTEIRELQKEIFGEIRFPIHWGGEVIFGNGRVLKLFSRECRQVFLKLANHLDVFTPERDRGDEVVLSIAADNLNARRETMVRTINPYMHRYWTSNGFNLIATNYRYNPVSIWHLPLEKKEGILRVYNYLKHHGRLPPRQELIHMVHLEKTEFRIIKDMILKRLRRWGLWHDPRK